MSLSKQWLLGEVEGSFPVHVHLIEMATSVHQNFNDGRAILALPIQGQYMKRGVAVDVDVVWISSGFQKQLDLVDR